MDVDLISPKFRTVKQEEWETSPQSGKSLVSSWSQLDSGTNSRLEELCLPDTDTDQLLPCQRDEAPLGDLEDPRIADLESFEEEGESDLQNNCDNKEKEEVVEENEETILEDEGQNENDVCDKENLTPEENEEVEVKTGKRKNKKRRKHAKKKPQIPSTVEVETEAEPVLP